MYKIPPAGPGPGTETLAEAAPPPPEAASPATAPAPAEHRDDFISLSAELTGFSEVELLGTGNGDLYLGWLARSFPDVLPELLAAWRTVVSHYPPGEREAALRGAILDDPKLGPFARAVLALWYAATWTPLGADWSKAYGEHAEDVGRAFGAAYPEGLMWRARVGAPPEATKPTGFGTWAFPPDGT
jgi:hypothetical protein